MRTAVKRMLAALLLAVLLPAAVIVPGLAESLPTLREVMADPALRDTRVEISDNMDAYVPYPVGEPDLGNLRIIILQRDPAKKEFTARRFDDLSQDIPLLGFDSDFTGVDIGSPRVWYRGDLMAQLPPAYRAESPETADIFLFAESEYILTGALATTDYADDGQAELPEFDTVEELGAFLQTHQRVATGATYYPKFSVVSRITIYNIASKVCYVERYRIATVKNFGRNPQAASHWDNMIQMAAILELFSRDPFNPEIVRSSILAMDFLPEEKLPVWKLYLDSEEYPALFYSLREYYWTMAKQLRDMDESEKNREIYDRIINFRDYDALALFAVYCDYSGFDFPVDEVEASGEYMAAIDYDWLEENMQQELALLQ